MNASSALPARATGVGIKQDMVLGNWLGKEDVDLVPSFRARRRNMV